MSGVIREKTNKRHLSLLASLSFHCQYIPPYTLVWWSIYILYTQIYVCILHLILYCQNVQSRQWLPSVVTVCVCCCPLSFTIGWNASNLSTAHREDTPDTLLVKLSQYFPFLRVSLHLIFIYLSTRNTLDISKMILMYSPLHDVISSCNAFICYKIILNASTSFDGA